MFRNHVVSASEGSQCSYFWALLLGGGVYIHDSMSTSTVAQGDVAASNRTIANWDVVEADWHALKARAHEDWVRISSK